MRHELEKRAASLADSGECNTYMDVQFALHREGFADTELLFLTREARERANSRCTAALKAAGKPLSGRGIPGRR